MALLSKVNDYPKPLTAIALSIGEESEPIAIVARPDEPALTGWIQGFPEDRRVASTEIQPHGPSKIQEPPERKSAFTLIGKRPGRTSILFSMAARDFIDLGRVDVVV